MTNAAHIIQELGHNARRALETLATAPAEQKNRALREAARHLREHKADILAANAKDMAAGAEQGLSAAMLDRLKLDDKRIEGIAAGLEAVAELADPVGEELAAWTRPNGLRIARVAVPIGVLGIIYESRPNVTADAGALCIKSGNAAILRGGSDSFHSSRAILAAMQAGLETAGLPKDAVQLVPSTDRALVGAMLNALGIIDIIVPRGGQSLTKRVMEESRVPTLLHLTGNCHTYIHKDADMDMAKEVLLNAKLRRTGICGATESVVIDRAVVAQLPKLLDTLFAEGCDIRGDAEAQKADSRLAAATEEDWGTEYLDAVLSVKTVENADEAIAHINRYGSHHTDAIITGNNEIARTFLTRVDSAIVMHNASTQFADGGEFGMGAEIGIATGRLHARGPVGAAQLTTYKYVVEGSGQTRPK